MLSPQICLLDLATSAPRPSLSRRTVYDGVLIENLVLSGDDEAGGADDAVRREADRVMDPGASRDGVVIADARAFDAYCALSWGREGECVESSRQPISKRLSSPIRMTSLRLSEG